MYITDLPAVRIVTPCSFLGSLGTPCRNAFRDALEVGDFLKGKDIVSYQVIVL
jgi:hypothetical protein